MMTHSSEKPYRCSEVNCGKAYASQSGLWYHKKNQHEENLRKDEMEVDEQASGHEEAGRPIVERRYTARLVNKRTQHKEKLQDGVEVEEQGLVHEEVFAGEEKPVHEEVLVKCEEVVKEEMVEMESDDMEGESDPLREHETQYDGSDNILPH